MQEKKSRKISQSCRSGMAGFTSKINFFTRSCPRFPDFLKFVAQFIVRATRPCEIENGRFRE